MIVCSWHGDSHESVGPVAEARIENKPAWIWFLWIFLNRIDAFTVYGMFSQEEEVGVQE